MTRKLWDRLSRKRPLSMPRDAEMCPSRSFDATPSHVEQSVLFFHDKPRPPSCESPARNCRRELISFSEQELHGFLMNETSMKAGARNPMLTRQNGLMRKAREVEEEEGDNNQAPV
ncbi:hypothetical protein HU200_003562 [Digitaria exilis]|uniref:Uncharacterized protein n=1 Tax=Digitaria exilis TaxID=1010633 RepID=A0A835KU61_9POAL|nr:hypothetical protein HU200_003562 [Digitaria exilis]